MANSQDKYGVVHGIEAIECDVAGLPARNHQLTHVALDRTSHEGMALGHHDRFFDQAQRFQGSLGVTCPKKVDQALEVVQRPGRMS